MLMWPSRSGGPPASQGEGTVSGATRGLSRFLLAAGVGLSLLAVSLCPARGCFADGWTPPSYNLEILTHFTQVAQQHVGSVVMTLEHTQDVTLNVSANGAGKEVFTCQAPGSTDTLLTRYKLTGADLVAPDTEWVSSSDFIQPSRTYLVPYTDGVSQITLEAQCTASDGRAQDAGSYTGSLIITATW